MSLDTPISESGFCGFALGAAIAGFKPIVEFNFAGLVFVSMDQIFNQVALNICRGKKCPHNLFITNWNKRRSFVIILTTRSVLAHLGIKSYMPSHASEVESRINLFTKKRASVIFLATEEFRNTEKLKN